MIASQLEHPVGKIVTSLDEGLVSPSGRIKRGEPRSAWVSQP